MYGPLSKRSQRFGKLFKRETTQNSTSNPSHLVTKKNISWIPVGGTVKNIKYFKILIIRLLTGGAILRWLEGRISTFTPKYAHQIFFINIDKIFAMRQRQFPVGPSPNEVMVSGAPGPLSTGIVQKKQYSKVP